LHERGRWNIKEEWFMRFMKSVMAMAAVCAIMFTMMSMVRRRRNMGSKKRRGMRGHSR
jgi:hypothetical protein